MGWLSKKTGRKRLVVPVEAGSGIPTRDGNSDGVPLSPIGLVDMFACDDDSCCVLALVSNSSAEGERLSYTIITIHLMTPPFSTRSFRNGNRNHITSDTIKHNEKIFLIIFKQKNF